MVPVEPTEAMLYHCASATPRKDYKDMLRFAPKDLSAVAVAIPEPFPQVLDQYEEGWNAALDALGVGK